MASASAAPPPPPPWVDLPSEIAATIFQKVGAIETLKNVQRVCKTWRNICLDPAAWRVIDMHIRDESDDLWDYDLEKMCRHAVDLSLGQVVDVNIEHFCSNKLLSYLAERCCQLRRLRIVCGYSVNGEGLTKAIPPFPLLEELHIYYTSVDLETFTAIGSSCPLLRSFSFNNPGYEHPHELEDQEAIAVAASMPQLHHLQLFGNKMSNEGLRAILDGCPRLQSLDLRHCFNLDLGGDLGARCFQQIKHVRTPHDSTEDYPYNCDLCDWGSFDEGYPSGFSDINLTSEEADSQYAYEFSDKDGMDSDYEFFHDY